MVKFYGRTKPCINDQGQYGVEWTDTEDILAIPFYLQVPGYRNETVNLLSLWSAHSPDYFNLEDFNQGSYIKAIESKANDETISKVLYPEDNFYAGRELRLKQQYFFVSASLQCIMKKFLKHNKSFDVFPDKIAVQLNDTHPTIAIPELTLLPKALALSTPPTSGETQIKFFVLIFFFMSLANIGVENKLSTGISKKP